MTTPLSVYGFSLDRDALPLAGLLDSEEQRRAAAFVFPHDRDRWTVARATLRLILAERLQIPPSDVLFATTPSGKPFLRDNHTGLQFNLSHSGGHAAVILAEGIPVGIDL